MFVYRIQHKDSGIGPFAYKVKKLISDNMKRRLQEVWFDEYYPFLAGKTPPTNGPVCHIVNHKIGVKDKQSIIDWFNGHFGCLHYFDYVVAVYQVKKTEIVDRTFLKNQVGIPIKKQPKYIVPIEKFCKKVKVPFHKFGVV